MNSLSSRTLLAVAALGVMPAWCVGLGLMLASDAPLSLVLVNAVAAALGMALLMGVGVRLGWMLTAWPGRIGVFVVAMLGLSLVFEPMVGVRRWLVFGPIWLHPSALLCPLVLLCLVQLWRAKRFRDSLGLLAAIQGLHVVQPDAGQATAFAIACLWLSWSARAPHLVRIAGAILAIAGAVASWSRPDPLEPVRFVEDMVPLAFDLHLALGIVALLSLAALPGAAWSRGRERFSRGWSTTEARVLAAYFAATIVVTVVGHFPTPILGHGASPILGAIIGLGLLARESPAAVDDRSPG